MNEFNVNKMADDFLLELKTNVYSIAQTRMVQLWGVCMDDAEPLKGELSENVLSLLCTFVQNAYREALYTMVDSLEFTLLGDQSDDD